MTYPLIGLPQPEKPTTNATKTPCGRTKGHKGAPTQQGHPFAGGDQDGFWGPPVSPPAKPVAFFATGGRRPG